MRFSFFILFVFIINLNSNMITPIEQNLNYDYNKALLGKKLFFDSILSKDNTISCATCHDIYNGGDDGLEHSFGINAQEGVLNSPTVLNAVFNFRQMWNGKAKDLAQQAILPIENPIEMGHDLNAIVEILKQDKTYFKLFKESYKSGITRENIIDALVQFQTTLITPSPFDEYLLGNENAITSRQKQGYDLFKRKGCIACHNGINIGGASYSKLGIINPIEFEHTGLYEITQKEMDKYFFKVPTLRNIEVTAPYFHDGNIQTLYNAIKIIAVIQLGIELEHEEILLIEEFLKSLTGKVEIIK